MTEAQVGPILVSIAVLLAAAHALGFLALRLRQPRFVGEILAGVLVGPFVLGRAFPEATERMLGTSGSPTSLVLGFVSWLGLLLLMFVAGAEVRRVLAREQWAPTAWILSIGTAIPFVIAFGLAIVFPLSSLHGPNGGEGAFAVSLATATAITSIPVISRIFHDLKILHTRFASIVLGTAMMEDVGLFAALAVATTLAAYRPGEALTATLVTHIGTTIAFLLFGLLVAPRVLRWVGSLRVNVLARRQRVAYALLLMFVYTAAAVLLDVNIVFGAFLAGFGLVGGFSGSEREHYAGALAPISRVAFATFIPLYFVLVGTKLDLGAGFSLAVLLVFLLGSSVLRMASVGTAGRLARFSRRDATDLAVAMNARGGPGIVLATIVYEAGIISATLFTALVITAVVTSQFAGWWLDRAIRTRRELLGEPVGTPEHAGDGGTPDDVHVSRP
jgi:Kef-type K+ transport system membrane component KefB